MKFPSESEIRAKYFLNTQIPKSEFKKWMDPQSTAITRSTNPALKFRSESEIRAKIFSKSADRWPIHPPMNFYETQGMSKLKQDSACARCVSSDRGIQGRGPGGPPPLIFRPN